MTIASLIFVALLLAAIITALMHTGNAMPPDDDDDPPAPESEIDRRYVSAIYDPNNLLMRP